MAGEQSKTQNPKSKILYLDPFSGIAGDMLLGALLDLGLDLGRLHNELGRLKLSGYRLSAKRVMRGAISGTKFDVEVEDAPPPHRTTRADAAGTAVWAGAKAAHAHHRTCADIKAIIESSGLSDTVKAGSLRVFSRLAEAEGKVHGLTPEQVHFHEVGALDSIIDIVGACIGLEQLGIGAVWCGPIALGSGTVACAHGVLPVPAPATLELMQGLPVRETTVEQELTTPTGAALVAALAAHFGPMPDMTVEKIGYGAGAREQQAIPNILRVVMGTLDRPGATGEASSGDTVLEIRTNIDNSSPEVLGYLSETLLSHGALDVFFTPIQMKKSRPATLLTVLAEPPLLDTVAGILFKECATFGLRYQNLSRLKLARRTVTVSTEYGPVRVKIGEWQGQVMGAHPEFEDCRARAEEKGVALRVVMDAARAAFEQNRLA
ncbi:MAG: nickel pincer cofactor biosynthesis protein LarC [Planctomycetota bacterium]|nr:nickel pincer cofactor biosynthesis protein LarC [Planctomycetota bacterium]